MNGTNIESWTFTELVAVVDKFVFSKTDYNTPKIEGNFSANMNENIVLEDIEKTDSPEFRRGSHTPRPGSSQAFNVEKKSSRMSFQPLRDYADRSR